MKPLPNQAAWKDGVPGDETLWRTHTMPTDPESVFRSAKPCQPKNRAARIFFRNPVRALPG